jgi:hypothetical protein
MTTQDEIKSAIANQILKPVPITDAEYHAIRAFNEGDSIHLEGLNVGLYKAFGWIGANPNSERKQKLSQIFYTLEHSPSNQSTSLPTTKGIDCLISLLTTGKRADESAKYSDIFIVGARGSGKSAAVNYIFNSKFKEVTSNKTTLFRADIAKLHTDINAPRHSRGEKAISISKYVILHAFMVALEYSDGNEEALKLFFPYKNRRIHNPSTAFDKNYLTEEQRKYWHQIVIEYRKLYHLTNVKNSDLIEFINNTNASIPELMALELWQKFCDFLKSPQGGRLDRIVLIFDGVDNLRTDQFIKKESKGKSNHKWYEDYLNELYQFYRRQPQTPKAEQFVFSFRNSTWEDFRNLTNTGLAHEENGHLVLNCEPQKPARIFLKRLVNYTHADARDLVADAQGFDDASGSRSATYTTGKLNRIKIDLTNNTNLLLSIFAEELYKYAGLSKGSWNRAEIAAKLIKYVFNGNIRSFLRNMVLSHVAVEKYNLQQSLGITAEHRFECSILAGNFLFPPNFNEFLKGRWCPNLFEINTQQKNNKWIGLSCIRILQILPRESADQERRSLTFNEIKTFLTTLGYEEQTIELSTQMLFEFGLIQVREERDGPNAKYYKTDKGDFIQWLVFNNVSVFYLMAVSSKFSRHIDVKPFAREKIDGVWMHKKNSPRFFVIAAARTSVQYLRSIRSAHNHEQIILEKSTTNLQIELKKYIVEPEFSCLIEDLSKRLSTDSYSAEVNALLREWRG